MHTFTRIYKVYLMDLPVWMLFWMVLVFLL